MTQRKITLIKFFSFAGNIAVPFYAFAMYLTHPKTFIGLCMFFFVSTCIIERAWETFRTSSENRRDEFHGDWTLAALTASYLILFFLFIHEFYGGDQKLNFFATILGLTLWSLSFRFRFWGMAALGKQWAIHAVGAQKIRKVRLIKLGPYKYIRHPIYLGIILEVLSYPIIANALYSFIFAALICIPLIFVRARTEEKFSVRRFGNSYKAYRETIGMFFPKQKH